MMTSRAGVATIAVDAVGAIAVVAIAVVIKYRSGRPGTGGMGGIAGLLQRRGRGEDRAGSCIAGLVVMRAAARLMPPAAGRRWLAEADSFLFEAPSVLRRSAVRSYLAGVPAVITAAWAGELARRVRAAGSRAGQP
jgi:hypothetical protein